MRITGLDFWQARFTLNEPYAIAYETVTTATNIFVRLTTDEGIAGFGCAAPDREVTGETPADVLGVLRAASAGLLGDVDPCRPAEAHESLRGALGFRPSALAALDMACWDILSKARQEPLWQLLGGARPAIRTSVTIGILSSDDTVARARHWLDKGFTFLKLKGGLDAAEDARRVLCVRDLAPSITIGFDANQGYSVPEALTFLEQAARADLAFLEQPTPRQSPEMLHEIQRQAHVPIVADESLTTYEDAEELARRQAVRIFNIKIMKIGGISPALAIDGLARRQGIATMVGCLDESALGISAGLHFALGRANVVHADLDGHFALDGDPAAKAIECREGYLHPGNTPGLGVELKFPV